MSAEDEAQQVTEEGERLFKTGEFAQAVAAYDRALTLKPDYAGAWYNRGIALGKLGRHQEAVESYDKTLGIDPRDAETWARRGIALAELGRHQEAVGSCDRALALDLQLGGAWIIRGIALGELGRHQEAVESSDKALALNPQYAVAWSIRGNALGKMGRHQEAVESYDKTLALEPQYAEAWNFRGHALSEMGRYLEAVESYEKAIRLKEDDFPDAWDALVNILLQLENWLKKRLPPKPHVEAFELVSFIEERLHMFIRQRLQGAFGKEEGEWWPQISLPIRQKCAQRREEDLRRRPLYNQTDLLDLKDIMYKHWKLFEPDFQKVKGQVKSKPEFLKSLERLNEVRKEVMHPVRGGLTEDDLAFARQMREAIEKFASLE